MPAAIRSFRSGAQARTNPSALTWIFACLGICILLTGCTGLPGHAGPRSTVGDTLLAGAPPTKTGSRIDPIVTSGVSNDGRETIVESGESAASLDAAATVDPALAGRSLQLNFVDTDIREFARILFSEQLKVPYAIDPAMTGYVTVRSSGTVDGNRAIALARQALEPSGYSIRVSDGVYRVLPLANAGFDTSNTRTFELNFIDSTSARDVLTGFLEGRAQIITTTKSSITVRGDTESLSLVESIIASMDIDRFRTASFGLFPLKYGNAESVSRELASLYSGVGATGQSVLPITRLNSILIIAPKVEHLEFAQKWLARLDKGQQDERRVFVYQVQNRDADELAKLLNGIFGGAAGPTPAAATVAESNEGESITSPTSFLSGAGSTSSLVVTADGPANKLVIRATPSEYDLVIQALQRLDVAVSQVYVEATIAEVRLNSELSHGVRWFLQANAIGAGFSDADNGAVAPGYPGFNVSLQVPHASVVISMLESHTDVRIVSTPQLTVIDRETATIQVGDQVPVVTRTVADASSGKTVIANDVAFRDTGIILKVTPQIRSSGEVLLDIEQEVSRVVPTTSSKINSPTISQRKIASTVLVPDGQAIVLAGLMSSNDEGSYGGLPGTGGPILESLFGKKSKGEGRSELIAIIRPVIIRDKGDLREVATEVAAKMRQVMQLGQ